jgi:hypothetical protein
MEAAAAAAVAAPSNNAASAAEVASASTPAVGAPHARAASSQWLIGLGLAALVGYACYMLVTEPDNRVRLLCVGFLCVQYSAYALLRRYATGILREEWSAASVLGIGELIKFVIALGCIGVWTSASEAPPGPLSERLGHLLRGALAPSPQGEGETDVCRCVLKSRGLAVRVRVRASSRADSGKMAVPAFLYLVMNTLGFIALRHIDAGTFAVIQQTKAFFTALFQR